MATGLYRGTVLRIDGGDVYVGVPNVGVDSEFGPCEVPGTVSVGDKVLVAQVDDFKEDLVIVTVLYDSMP